MTRERSDKAGAADASFQALLDDLRRLIGGPGLTEQKMFGGLCFLIDGNMVAGASPARGLLLRVGKQAYPSALAQPAARPMEMRGRPMEGYFYVDTAALTPADLADWIALAVSFVRTLPPKVKAKSKQR